MDTYIEINGQKIHYRLSGQGSPVILMHGWGCSSKTLASIEHIAAETHTVYNIDLPGFGLSDEPRAVWGVEEYTEMLEAFVARLGICRPILLGHSFGGRICIMYSSRHSSDVDKVVLVDAAGVKPPRRLSYYLKVYGFKAAKKFWQLVLGHKRAQERIDKMRAKRGSSDYSSSTPMMRAILSKTVNQDLCEYARKMQVPTLLIWGENDTATPLSDAKKLERLIPDAGLVCFPGCGHYSFLDNPHQFGAVLRSFIN
ncbi:MAG: alpha/beta hydrolase [Muribaculaceae bacterium]|nr:alpha/beta hydrolase [Muribaculaceae bacterium]